MGTDPEIGCEGSFKMASCKPPRATRGSEVAPISGRKPAKSGVGGTVTNRPLAGEA